MRSLDTLRGLLEPTPPTDPVDALTDLAKTLQDQGQEVAKRRTPGVERVPLDELQVDHDYQRPPDREKIAAFRATLRAGGTLPAIKANRRHDGSLWVTDGQHRAAAAALEGHTHVDARITDVASWEEPQETDLVTKVAAEDDSEMVSRLRCAGAVHKGKRLVLDLGKAGQIAYAPHREPVGTVERGLVSCDGARAAELLDRLDLRSLVGTTAV